MTGETGTYGIIIDVFSRCNLRCPSCIVGNKYGRADDWPKGIMEIEQLDEIISKAKKEATIDWVGLYNWTEPLLHPELHELIEVVNHHGIHSDISSNLNVKKDYNFERLLFAKPTSMRISLSGFSQSVYERGHAGGNIELVKQNMTSLAKARDKQPNPKTWFEVFYHVYNYNVHEIDLMRNFCEKLDFKFSYNYAQLFPIEKIIEIQRGHKTEADLKLLDDLCLPLDEALEVASKFGSKSCRLLDNVLTINVSGDVLLCCGTSMNKENVIGSFLELTVQNIQQLKSEHSLCATCMNYGIPTYFSGCKELTKAFEQNLDKLSGR